MGRSTLLSCRQKLPNMEVILSQAPCDVTGEPAQTAPPLYFWLDVPSLLYKILVHAILVLFCHNYSWCCGTVHIHDIDNCGKCGYYQDEEENKEVY